MWYEDRWSNATNHGYAINTAASPRGPFVPLTASVVLPGNGRVGDFDLFVDDDGRAYHVRTGLTIVQLDATFTAAAGPVAEISNPGVEAPTMFKHGGVYFLLAGRGCCACLGGSNIEVALQPLDLVHPILVSNSSFPF
jgi:beta-xylosidase